MVGTIIGMAGPSRFIEDFLYKHHLPRVGQTSLYTLGTFKIATKFSLPVTYYVVSLYCPNIRDITQEKDRRGYARDSFDFIICCGQFDYKELLPRFEEAVILDENLNLLFNNAKLKSLAQQGGMAKMKVKFAVEMEMSYGTLKKARRTTSGRSGTEE